MKRALVSVTDKTGIVEFCKELVELGFEIISTGGTIARLYNDGIERAKISIPPLDKQKEIVEKLDQFDKITNDLTQGLPAEIQARQQQYDYYRNKLLTFKELKGNK